MDGNIFRIYRIAFINLLLFTRQTFALLMKINTRVFGINNQQIAIVERWDIFMCMCAEYVCVSLYK